MSAPHVSAVLFVRDLDGLTEFYRVTLDLAVAKRAPDHTILRTAGFDLVVHQIPQHITKSLTTARPPKRREAAAIKLCFPVADIAGVRALAASLGGVVDPPESEWSDGEATTCKGHDPEGNVFQVSQVPRRRS